MVTQAERDKTIKIARTMLQQCDEQARAQAYAEVLDEMRTLIHALTPQNKLELLRIWDQQDAMNATMNEVLAEVKSKGEQQ